MIEKLKIVALKEIEEQTFELTKSYLTVNKLVYKNNEPQIDDVIVNEEEGTAAVYFPIENEEYYFVIYLDISPQIRVRFMGMSAGSRVYFSVSSEDIELEKLVDEIDIMPIRTWQKGTKIPNLKIDRFYEDSGFILEYDSRRTGEVEDKLLNILDKLECLNLISIVKSDNINRVLQVVYYGYKDEMWGINLNPIIIKKLSMLNTYLDIDLYASGPNLE
ncbi:DUF4279 domain-containing protein [Paenibacillus vini]|uniref:DUF4279 domain-containing protein n=1 Tax=Paenibacillus vini TaxID=1476024 RepID=A0ABQ4MB87_9BACL|nr:DUF4279 domain-containing protein [Paenibacillus vini]GIP53254.1 hypothetical protein J42TS3_22890 [Paenibacillus vini]